MSAVAACIDVERGLAISGVSPAVEVRAKVGDALAMAEQGRCEELFDLAATECEQAQFCAC